MYTGSILLSITKTHASKNDNDENKKASLVASFFGPTSANQGNSFKEKTKQNIKIPERASYEPENTDDLLNDDDEDDDIERLIKAAEMENQNKQNSIPTRTSPVAPPVPTR